MVAGNSYHARRWSFVVSASMAFTSALLGMPSWQLISAAEHNVAGQLTLRGTVLLPDGSPAADATVLFGPGSDRWQRTVKTDSAGRFAVSDVFGSGVRLQATSPDGGHIATLSISAPAARKASASPIELKLKPAKAHTVGVTADGKPVAGVIVSAVGHTFQVESSTDELGRAVLQIPSDNELTQLVAWHPQLGVDGVRRGDSLQYVDFSRLALRAPTNHVIRVVDTEGKAVKDIELQASARTDDSVIVAQSIAATRVRTDASGSATLAWVPRDGLKYVSVSLSGDDGWKIDEIDLDETSSGQTTVHVRRIGQVVEGQLFLPAASAEGILITGFGFGPGHGGDIPYARTRRDGSFTLPVASDHGYVLGIVDQEWAGELWSGTPLSSDGSEATKISIEGYAAIPLSVRVTRGADAVPVADAWVEVSRNGSVSFRDGEGKQHNGQGGVRYWLRTDNEGKAVTGVGRGAAEVRLSSWAWEDKKQIVASSQEVSVEFHRAWRGDRHIRALLIADGKAFEPSKNIMARAWVPRPPFMPIFVEPQRQAHGLYDVAFDGEKLQMLFIDRDNRRSGFVEITTQNGDIEMAMRPMAKFSGVLLDADGQKLSRKSLRLRFLSAGRETIAMTQTDEAGEFVFDALPVEVPLSLSIDNEARDSSQFYVFDDDVMFQPGEVRTAEKVYARLRGRPSPKPAVPLAEAVANNCQFAALSRMRGLVVLEGDSSAAVTDLASKIMDYDRSGTVRYYLPKQVTAGDVEKEKVALESFAWPMPQPGQVVLIVLDGEQMTLASQAFTAADSVALEQADAFLKAHKPPVADAMKLLEEARKLAAETGRKVWVVDGGPRCGPCFRLGRWMHDHHEVLEKDYVIVKLMGGLDDRHEEARKQLSSQQHSIPWYMITEPGGNVLITSEGPLGNIGMPGSFESVGHFRAMLQKTATHMAPEEREQLAKSLLPAK